MLERCDDEALRLAQTRVELNLSRRAPQAGRPQPFIAASRENQRSDPGRDTEPALAQLEPPYDVALGGESTATVRRPRTVGALALVTLGIYGLFWYFKANRELRSFGQLKNDPDLDVNPAVATLAVSLTYAVIVPNLIIDDDGLDYLLAGLAGIPFLISWFRTLRRVRKAQELEATEGRLNVWAVMVLVILTVGPIPPLPLAVEFSWTVAGLAAVFFLYRLTQAHLNQVWTPYASTSA
jgi:hypothetical protein